MSRKAALLILSLLVLAASIIGGSQQSVVYEQNIQPSSFAASFNTLINPTALGPFKWESSLPIFIRQDVRITSHVSKVTINRAPAAEDKLITALLLDPNRQPSWLRLIENKGQSVFVYRVHSGTKLGNINSLKLYYHDNCTDLTFPPLFSKNLRESSPPGYFLLI